MNAKLKIGIFIFNEVEVLDFAGPFEVFSLAREGEKTLCEVVTIGEKPELITARNGLQVRPTCQFEDEINFDILIIPGGYGAEEIEIIKPQVIDWIKRQHAKVKILASVCTGALLLAECGLLDGKSATTHWMDLDRLQRNYPKVKVLSACKYVDEGSIITSGGISAGINMSFYILQKLFGGQVATDTAKRMEYDIEL